MSVASDGDAIRVVHPAPVFHRPPRARADRVSYVRHETPVRLRSLGFDETDEGPSFQVVGGGTVDTRLIDGAMWRLVGADSWWRGPAHYTRTDRFRSWLAGERDFNHVDGQETGRSLAGTPLVARRIDAAAVVRSKAIAPGGNLGTVLFDGREAAAAALRDFVERDLLLVDDMPMVRLRGPLAYHDGMHGVMRLARHPGIWATDQGQSKGLFFRYDRAARGGETLFRATVHAHWYDSQFKGTTPSGDDDLALTAAFAIRRIGECLLHQAAGWGRALPPETARRILVEACLGSVGCPSQIGIDGLYDLAETAVRSYAAAGDGLPFWGQAFLDYREKLARPILEAGRSADAEASLASLAP